MPRAEVGTPKYIANKMKAKGLQKLRWYCQMCQKQCRDENGFKCHTMSESHQRQILLFADNSKRYIDDFSYEFAKEYLEILRRQFGTKRVNANRVYQEYIADRNHLHMNATRWVTLTGFVKYLGHTGKCIVDETEKGWFITYIDRDPDTIAAEERKLKKLKMDKDDEEKQREFVEKQVELAKDTASSTSTEYTDLKRDEEEPIKLKLDLTTTKKTTVFPMLSTSKTTVIVPKSLPSTSKQQSQQKSKSSAPNAIDEIMAEEEARRERSNRRDYWLTEGIIVKIMTKSLGDNFYKQKGVIRKVENKYAAIVKLLDGAGKKVRVDQEHLETVIPALGKPVRLVNGAYRGENATLVALDEARYCVKVRISNGLLMGREITGVVYEDVCKLDENYLQVHQE